MAAEIADGWLPLYYSPFHPEVYADSLKGAPDGFEIIAGAQVNINDDLEQALMPVKMMIGFYIGGMGAKGQNYHTKLMERFGFEDEALKIQELFFDGKRDEAIAAVPDEFADAISLCGSPDAHPRPGRGLGRERRVDPARLLPRRPRGPAPAGRDPALGARPVTMTDERNHRPDRQPSHPTDPAIDLTDGPFYGNDPHPHFTWMRANAPVYFDENSGVWGITRYADLQGDLGRPEDVLERGRHPARQRPAADDDRHGRPRSPAAPQAGQQGLHPPPGPRQRGPHPPGVRLDHRQRVRAGRRPTSCATSPRRCPW